MACHCPAIVERPKHTPFEFFLQIIKEYRQIDIVTMQIMQMYYIRVIVSNKIQKFPCFFLRIEACSISYARTQGMKMHIDIVAYAIYMLIAIIPSANGHFIFMTIGFEVFACIAYDSASTTFCIYGIYKEDFHTIDFLLSLQ